MIPITASIVIGYLLGTLSPSALISKIKKKNLRQVGTKNLGASNTMLIFGKGYGAFVMLFDIAKAFFASKLAELIFPGTALVGIVAGSCAVVGHVFPFYMKFKGGKGLASFGGMILAYDPIIFLILLVLSLTLMIIVNYSGIMPLSAASLFPFLAGFASKSIAVFIISLTVSALIIFEHRENIVKMRHGTDIAIRDYIKNHLFKKSK